MVKFQKYEGTGNDFIVTESDVPFDIVPQICDRRLGVGADGVLLLSEITNDSVRMTIINADGSRPEMCGNGVRCVARYMYEHHAFPSEFVVVSDAGEKACVISVDGNFSVSVNMGYATLLEQVQISEGEKEVDAFSVDIGNPHAVVFDEEDSELLDEMGARLNRERVDFPAGVNLEFVKREGNDLRMVVFERGVGRTHACGTGACAVAFAAWDADYIEAGPVDVLLPGGRLKIEQREDGIWMKGAVNAVFSGEYPT